MGKNQAHKAAQRAKGGGGGGGEEEGGFNDGMVRDRPSWRITSAWRPIRRRSFLESVRLIGCYSFNGEFMKPESKCPK
jgi:hypothetical protein